MKVSVRFTAAVHTLLCIHFFEGAERVTTSAARSGLDISSSIASASAEARASPRRLTVALASVPLTSRMYSGLNLLAKAIAAALRVAASACACSSAAEARMPNSLTAFSISACVGSASSA